MLTKEEYLSIIEDFEGIFFEMEIVYNFQDIQKLKDLIKEYFELVEYAKKLQDEVDLYKYEYYAECDRAVLLQKELNEIKNPKPYKFEDLKPNLWVWYDKWEECFEICKIFPKDNEVYVLIHQNRINVKRNEPIKFEEGRFFPVTKALEY